MRGYLQTWSLQFLFFFLGCFICLFIQNRFQLPSVVAAALIGFVGSFIPESRHIESIHVHSLLYMGAFVAMGSRVVDMHWLQIGLISVLGTAFYLLLSPYFKGFGGRLGMYAFITSILGLLIRMNL